MQAGKLDRRVRLLRHSAGSKGALGEKASTWTPAETLWASRQDVSDAEAVRASAVGRALSVRFVVRSSTVTRAITSLDRLLHEGRTYEIVGIKEVGRRDGIEISAATTQAVAS